MRADPDTLLIIDDNPEDREFLRHALREEFHVIEAELGEQGLALIEKARPTCVLLDYFLPDMDGLELLAARGPGQEDDYGLIVLTGSDEASLAVACMKQGAHDYLIKGRFNRYELRRTIAGSLEKLALRRQLRAQQLALQASEQRLGLFIEHAPACLAMFDRQMRYLAVSRRWLHNHGLSELDIQSRSHFQLFPDTPESWKAIYRRGLAGEILRADEDCFVGADGQVQWLRWEVRPWHEAQGQIGGIVVFTEDITALKQAKQELERHRTQLEHLVEERTRLLSDERERLARILEGTRAGTWEWNIQTGEARYNERWAEIIGYRHAEIAPTDITTWRRFAHPDDLARSDALLQRYFAGEQDYFEFEARMHHKEGRWVWVLARGKIVARDAAGTPLLMAGIHLDITRTKEAELSLIQAKEQAEEASRAKSRFLANMSHELRTPFDAVIGLLQLLEQTPLNDRQHGYVDRARQSARSLLALVGDLLDFSRIEAGKLELEEMPFSLSGLVAEVVSLFAPSARAKGLTLEGRIDPRLTDAWIGDRARLHQILTNLVGNAVKFTPRGAIRVEVDSAAERVAGVRDADASVPLRFSVTDQGLGIGPEHLEVIFDSFQQLDPSMTRRFGGTGLGLAICKGLVTLLGGEIQVESTPGTGSCFRFVLPLRQDPAPGRAAAPVTSPRSQGAGSAPPSLGGLRLLVAEDSEVNRFVAQEMLTSLGARVDVADNGETAARLALEADPRYDLVLMDLQMPLLSGLDVSRRLRAMDPTRTTPILAMTANVRAGDRLAAEDAGMSGFLAKPIDWPAAAARILALCGHGAGDLNTAHRPAGGAPSVALPSLPGLDLAGALDRLEGSRPIYCAMAKRFLDTETEIFRRLMRHLDQDSESTAIKALHPVRGTALALGALPLAEVAHRLEEALRMQASTDVATLKAQLEVRWGETLANLRQAVAALESEVAPARSNQPLQS
ncbi:Sensory/regulatory protein RpfC [Thiorhodovibrio winogradskyi]|uniref:histidine kinase n=1 Tax=Thiorhodovibrio winogradskyi TaxID=77007 RepID=A0ABZ0SAE9_9GAMM|nr:response regulator [Thiorhodovibrio winogradskyi]